MILMSAKDVNKKNFYADAHTKERTSTMLKIRATMIDAAPVTRDQKLLKMMLKVSIVDRLNNCHHLLVTNLKN